MFADFEPAGLKLMLYLSESIQFAFGKVRFPSAMPSGDTSMQQYFSSSIRGRGVFRILPELPPKSRTNLPGHEGWRSWMSK